MSGEPIDAEEAFRIGLVSRIASEPDLIPTATEMAEKLCENAPLSLEAVKQVVRFGLDMPRKDAWEKAAPVLGSVWQSEDAREGVAAFVQKRKPVWKAK